MMRTAIVIGLGMVLAVPVVAMATHGSPTRWPIRRLRSRHGTPADAISRGRSAPDATNPTCAACPIRAPGQRLAGMPDADIGALHAYLSAWKRGR